jgi:hypothetical protein
MLHNSGRGAVVALRVFGREVFNGQLPSNALAIHVTTLFYDIRFLGIALHSLTT